MTQDPPVSDSGSDSDSGEVGVDAHAGDGDGDTAPEPEWVRRRRLEKAFGSGEHHGGGKDDSWYRDQVPPHHG